MRGVKRYQDKKGETFLSSAELAKLGQAVAQCESEGASPAPIAIIRLLAFTGARKSEIASLKWSEVDLQRGYLALGDSKTGAKIIPLGACRRSPMRRRAHRGRDLYLSSLFRRRSFSGC
ncbi:MAG: hypothetical protein M3178_08145 [Pseudomonadota bacterium]|nr:hypothetical protein [Pseudomonadota bacterium]